jgi:hypothetical protein
LVPALKSAKEASRNKRFALVLIFVVIQKALEDHTQVPFHISVRKNKTVQVFDGELTFAHVRTTLFLWRVTRNLLPRMQRANTLTSRMPCEKYRLYRTPPPQSTTRRVDRFLPIFTQWLPAPRVLHPYPIVRFLATHPRWEPYA